MCVVRGSLRSRRIRGLGKSGKGKGKEEGEEAPVIKAASFGPEYLNCYFSVQSNLGTSFFA